MPFTLARLLLNRTVISELAKAALAVADMARRRRDAAPRSLGSGATVDVRLDALEATVVKESEVTAGLATQLRQTAAALEVIASRLTITLVMAGVAVLLSFAALLVALLR